MADVEQIARQKVTIDLSLPEHWVFRHFWKQSDRRVFGVVLAFSPRILAIGIEHLNGYGKGLALMLGPFWFGAVTARLETSDDH